MQRLLTPLALEMSPEQAEVVGQELTTLRELGVDIEPFGGNAYLLRAVPAILRRDDPQKALGEILDGLVDRKDTVDGTREAELITLICKRAAVKGGHLLSLLEMQEMVRQLEFLSCAPHLSSRASNYDSRQRGRACPALWPYLNDARPRSIFRTLFKRRL